MRYSSIVSNKKVPETRDTSFTDQQTADPLRTDAHLFCDGQPCEGFLPRELPLKGVGGVVRTEHFRREPGHK